MRVIALLETVSIYLYFNFLFSLRDSGGRRRRRCGHVVVFVGLLSLTRKK